MKDGLCYCGDPGTAGHSPHGTAVKDLRDIYSEGLTVGMNIGRKDGLVKAVYHLTVHGHLAAAQELQALYDNILTRERLSKELIKW